MPLPMPSKAMALSRAAHEEDRHEGQVEQGLRRVREPAQGAPDQLAEGGTAEESHDETEDRGHAAFRPVQLPVRRIQRLEGRFGHALLAP